MCMYVLYIYSMSISVNIYYVGIYGVCTIVSMCVYVCMYSLYMLYTCIYLVCTC